MVGRVDVGEGAVGGVEFEEAGEAAAAEFGELLELAVVGEAAGVRVQGSGFGVQGSRRRFSVFGFQFSVGSGRKGVAALVVAAREGRVR